MASSAATRARRWMRAISTTPCCCCAITRPSARCDRRCRSSKNVRGAMRALHPRAALPKRHLCRQTVIELPRCVERPRAVYRPEPATRRRSDMNAEPAPKERVLVLAPTPADTALTENILREAGFTCHVCADTRDLSRELRLGAGTVLVTEEVYSSRDVFYLVEAIRGQADWSDFSVLLLVSLGVVFSVLVC